MQLHVSRNIVPGIGRTLSVKEGRKTLASCPLPDVIRAIRHAELTFHKDIGFPRGTQLPQGTVALSYSRHAIQRADERGFWFPKTLNLGECTVVEITFRDETSRFPVKLLVRMPYDATYDACLVLTNHGYVITAYLNERQDSHSTLNKKKYAVPA